MATERHDEVRRSELACSTERSATRSALDTLIGEERVMSAEIDPAQRAAATDLVARRQAEVAHFPDVSPNSAAELDAAERQLALTEESLQHVTREFHQESGALTKVAGAATKEELSRAEETKQQLEDDQAFLELDTDAWKLLQETMREVEDEQGAHLGRALAGPVAASFSELTHGRYSDLTLDANLTTTGVSFVGGTAEGKDVLSALSVGTRNQLATLLRLAIAEQLGSSLILDDQLVNTDEDRLVWFHDSLRKVALKAQVIVLTCRPRDYLKVEQMPESTTFRDLGGGIIRAIDMAGLVQRQAT